MFVSKRDNMMTKKKTEKSDLLWKDKQGSVKIELQKFRARNLKVLLNTQHISPICESYLSYNYRTCYSIKKQPTVASGNR